MSMPNDLSNDPVNDPVNAQSHNHQTHAHVGLSPDQPPCLACLQAVTHIVPKLAACPDLETLGQKAVEWAKTDLDLAECTVLVGSDPATQLAYGSDEQGQVVQLSPEVLQNTLRQWAEQTESTSVQASVECECSPASGENGSAGLDRKEREPGSQPLRVIPLQIGDQPSGSLGYFGYRPQSDPRPEPVEREIANLLATTLSQTIDRLQIKRDAQSHWTQLQVLLEHLPFGVWLGTLDQDYELQNPTAIERRRAILGYGAAELSKSDDLQETLQSYTLQVIQGGGVQTEEVCLIKGETYALTLIFARIMDLNAPQHPQVLVVSLDTTSQKRIEQVLREREEHSRQIVELAPIGIVITDIRGRFTQVNPAFCQITGYSPAELLGIPQAEIVHPVDEPDLQQQEQQLLTGQIEHDQTERRYLHREGLLIEVLVRTVMIRGTQRQPLHFLNLILDMTDYKLTEQDLRKSQEKYKTLFETLPLGVWMTDQEGHITEVNRAAEQILGVALSEQKQRRFDSSTWRMVRPNGIPLPANEYPGVLALLQNQVVEGMEMGLPQSDGSMTWLSVTSAPIPLTGYGVVVVFQDISEQRRAAAAVRESELWFRAMFEQAGLGISIANAEGRYLRINPALEELLGYSIEDLRDVVFADFTHPDDITTDLKLYQELVAGQRDHYQIEKRYIRKDGQFLWVRLTVSLIRDEHGQLKFTIGITENISERKQSEQRIKAALHEKEILLREIHHRVKNNLQIISSLLRLQSDAIKSRKYLKIFRDAWSRIQSMSLLHEELYRSKDFSKINLADYIQSLVINLFHSYGVKTEQITPILNVEEVALSIDAGILCGLILNELLTNCLKYAFPKSQEGRIWVEVTQDAHTICLSVRDDGVGLPEHFDLDQTESLGLQLVTTLTEQLEGTITFDRIEGSQFTIVFPRSES